MDIPATINRKRLAALLDIARAEDLGAHGDLTSLILPDHIRLAVGRWDLVPRRPGRFCSRALLPVFLSALAPVVQCEWIDPGPDDADVPAGSPIARLSGPVATMLATERTLLNFLQHLSGVATSTTAFVRAVAGTHAKIYDTRKTTPGLRDLEKYAVRMGGGHNHRAGLYDAVLLKDNHLAGIPTQRLAHAVFEMLSHLNDLPAKPTFVEIECDGLDQLGELLKVVGIDVILLDNFAIDDLRAAVGMRDGAGLRGKVELEASGGITIESVRAVAQTGVERIAVGAITHSAPIMDIGLDAIP